MGDVIPGQSCARLLVAAGCGRSDVIRALISEIGLNEREAQAAWESTAETRPNKRRNVINGRDYTVELSESTGR